MVQRRSLTLGENCPNSEIFLSVFSHIWIVFFQMQENTDQKNSKYRHVILNVSKSGLGVLLSKIMPGKR